MATSLVGGVTDRKIKRHQSRLLGAAMSPVRGCMGVYEDLRSVQVHLQSWVPEHISKCTSDALNCRITVYVKNGSWPSDLNWTGTHIRECGSSKASWTRGGPASIIIGCRTVRLRCGNIIICSSDPAAQRDPGQRVANNCCKLCMMRSESAQWKAK